MFTEWVVKTGDKNIEKGIVVTCRPHYKHKYKYKYKTTHTLEITYFDKSFTFNEQSDNSGL